MTKEQEEAIEILNSFKTIKVLYGNTFAMHLEQLEQIQNNIEIVLNLIQEQQKENEKKDKRVEIYQNMLATNDVLHILECEKKDKIIDLMAETISAITTGIPTIIKQFEEKYCEFINSDDDCCWKTDKSCKDCIKQYFENQAKM